MAVAVKEFSTEISEEKVYAECSVQFVLRSKHVLPALGIVKCRRGKTGMCFPRGRPLNEILRPYDEETGECAVSVSIEWCRRVHWALCIARGVEYIHGGERCTSGSEGFEHHCS
jgi:hypothetical protein